MFIAILDGYFIDKTKDEEEVIIYYGKKHLN